MDSQPTFSNPQEIVDRGEKIYETKYKAKLEKEHPGRFVAIDVVSQRMFLGEHPEEAIEAARGEAPRGVFHLIKIGSPSAFRLGTFSHERSNWIF